MAAEVSADLNLIQDEDVLRRMWADTEDFGKKKEIRARMYKLREQRLKDFYTTGEVVTEITGRKHLTTTHAESIGDQGFMSMKSKEIRDSESPTRDLNRQVVTRQGNNGYWNTEEERGFTSGNQDGVFVQVRNQTKRGEGLIVEGDTQTKIATAAQNVHEVQEKADDNSTMKAEKVVQSQAMASSSVTNSGDSTTESAEQRSSKSSKEEKVTHSSSQMSNVTSSSTSKKVVSSSSTSSSKTYVITSSGERKLVSEDIKVLPAVESVQSSHHESNLKSNVSQTSVIDQCHRDERYSQSNVSDVQMKEISSNNQRGSVADTAITDYDTSKENKHIRNSEETSSTRRTSQESSKFVNTEHQRISVQNQTLDSANVDDQYSRQSNFSLENNVLNKTLRNTDDTRNQSNQRNVINESKEIITSERISSSDTTDDSFLKSQRPERVKSAEPNAVKFPEKTTNETITKHEIRSTGHLEDSTKETFNKNESKTNQQILTEIQKLDTYLHDQHPTPAHSEPVTPKTATDNVKWTVVSKKDGEFVYHDEKAPFDGRPKDDYPRHDYQAREPQVKHPTSLDLRNDATDGQYVTTYAESYNRVSMDNSPSHQYFMTTLRASPASPTSGRLTPSSPTKSSRNSLDRASPERRVRPSSRGSQDRGSPSYQDRRSPDKGTRASPVQRRGSSDSYVVDKRKNSRRKTTEISQSTVKDSVSSKPKRKFSSTQQKAANKARASTPGASPSTSPTRSSRKKETTSGSESDVSNATYNKATSTQDVSITKENESIIALKKQTQEITTTRDREKSPEYSSEGSISREINKSKIHPTPIPSIHENSAFRPIKPKEETIQDNRQFITEEQNYTVEEQESIEKLPHSVNETVTITEIQDNDTNQRDLVQEEVPGNLSITTTTVISTEVSAHSKSKEQKPRKPSTTSPDRKRKTPDSPYSSPDRQSPKQRSVPERQPSSQGSSPERQVKKPTGTGTTRTRGSDQPKETRPQMSPTRTMEKEPRRMPTSSPEREVLTSKRTESTRLSSSDRVRSASSSPSPTRRTDIHTKSVTSRSLVTEESRTPRPHQSPMSSPTRRRTDNETTKIERKTTDRVSTIRNRTPVSPKSKLPEPKREPLSSTQTKKTAKTTTTSQKTSQTSRIQPTSAATSKPLSPRKPNEHTLTTKTTTMTTTRSSSVPKQQLSTRTTKTVTRTGSRPEEKKPTSPTKASTSRRPVEPSTPVQPRGRPQVPRSQLIETPKRTTPKTSSVRTTTTTVTLQKTRPSKIPAQSPSPVKGKPTNANQKEVKPKDSVVNINNEFITEERRQVTDLEDEYPPDEFYADYDDSSPERMPQTGTTKSPVKTKVTSSSTTIRKTATNEVNNKKISKKHKKEKKHTKSTDSSSSSSDDEIDAADQTAELSRQERDVNHTINQDLLNVVVQHPKSSRESSPGYPSAGVPFCSTSEDGESNPRYADFVSEPEDVEVFDKHRGPPSAPIQLSEEPNAPVPSVADRVNVFLENTRNLETVTKKDTLITSKPKSVLKKTELFENVARNQTLSTETKTTEDINITSVEEVDINDEIIENKIDSTFDKQPSTLKPDKETLRNVDTSSREITEITEIENMSDSRQLIENEIGKADIDYEITRVRIDKHDKPTVRGSDDVSPGKKPFERRPSGTAGDVSSKKTFFERKVKDTTTPGAKGREPKQGTARDSYETVDRKKSESSYVKSTTSSVISSKTERSPVKSTDLSPERPTNKRKSSKPEEITRKPSKGEDAMRKTSRPERTSPERRISQPDEIARKPSSPERRPVKLDDITNKQHRPGGFSPERKPSKPEEIHRRPSKPEEPKKSPSRPQEIHRKPTPTVPLEITKRPTKSEDVAKKVSKFENVTSTDSYSKTPKQPVSERPKSRHSTDRTDSSYMRSTVVSSVRSHTPESELPKDSRRTPSQESRHPSSKDTRSESYMRGTVASTVRSHTPDHQVPEEIRRRPSHDDDHLRPGEETDNLDQTRETRTESYMRSTVASSVRTHTPDQQAPGSVRRGSLKKEIPRGSDGRDSPDRGREHFMENTESSILRTVSPDRVHKEDSRSFILSERRSSATEETTRVTSSRTSEARRTEDRTSGKFGVTLRKTPSATKMTPSTKSKPTTSRQSSRTSDEVEDIFDLELLEEMLLKATGYDDRRRIRAQIRIVKKQIEEEKNAGFLSRTTTKTTTTSTTYSSDKQSPIPSTKDIKNLISGDRPVKRSPEQRRPTSSSFDRKGSSPERKYTSPERKVTSPERKVSSPERKFTSPERKASSPERKFTSPERKASSPERKFTSPERKVSSPERKVTSPERKPTGERRQVSPDRRSPERSPNRRSSQDKSSKVYYETSTTVRSQSVKRPSIGESPTDIITSSYGVGPTDENGRPLFGLKALRRTSTTKTLLDEKEVHEKTVENKEESSSLFGLRALQSETTTMPAESSQLKELVERHQQYVRENSSKDLQPRQKPKAKLRDSFILSQEDEAPLIQTPDDKSLSLKSIIKTEDGKTVRSSMESRSTVIKSHSSFSSDGKVSLHRDVIHGEVSSKNGEEPSGKITRSSYSYQSPNDKETPSIKSSTTTQVIGGRRGSGPRIEEITDSSHTTSNETNRRFSKEYTVEEEETVSERRRSSGVSVGESVKKYTSILKNSNQENLDSGRRASGPRITEILSSDRDEKLSSSTKRDSSSTSADVIDSKTSFSNVKSTEEKSDLSKKVITRGDSVKALQHKFQQATEAANQPPARTYPRAGLILRSNTRPQIDDQSQMSSSLKTSSVERSDSKSKVQETVRETKTEESRTSPTGRGKVTSQSTVVTTTKVSRSEEPTSFLDNRSKVTGVQDILSRMRNADLVSEQTDTAEDAEARALLNKFLGASVILQGMEQGMKSAQHTSSNLREERRQIVSETEVSARSPASAALVREVEKQRVKATSALTGEDDFDDINDEKQIRILLDGCSDYENRRKLRARLRTIMAEQKGGTDDGEESQECIESSSSQVVKDGNSIVKTEVHTRTTSSSAKLTKANSVQSPFAKFRQLERQNSAPSAGHPPPLFKFTEPKLALSASTIKERLLRWAQAQTQSYKNIQIENFSTSWSNGLAFCALIHHFCPHAFDYNTLTAEKRRYNFELAFRVAEEEADIFPLLDVEDMVTMRKPDWKCVFTYVQSIYRRFHDSPDALPVSY